MKKAFLYLALLLLLILFKQCQSIEPVAKVATIEIDHYRSFSKDLIHIVQEFSDTCSSLYGCKRPINLSFSPSNLYDSLGEVDVTAELLFNPDEFEERTSGKVILLVDSVNILIPRNLLNGFCRIEDSLVPLGKRVIEWKYHEFQTCLHQYGVVVTMKVSCLNENKPQVRKFGAYMPPEGKKKLEKAMRKK